MHLSRHALHVWILAAATLVAVFAFALPKKAGAQTPGYYTTTSTSTSTSSTDPVTGVTTTTTNSSSNVPRGIFSTRGQRNQSYFERGERTSDLQARYPYDNTNGRHRSDVDAARSGFDDPRNPWDGRYVNDSPANYNETNSGSNAVVNSMRGNENNDRYRPGNYGTRRIR